jgi:hypothetical protein
LVFSLHVTPFQVEGELLYCEVSFGAVWPLVPVQNHFSVFQQIHRIAHTGTRATQRLISARFVWPRMASAIQEWVRSCQHCARSKVHKHVHSSPQPIPMPRRKFAHVHVDLVGPFPVSCEGWLHSPVHYGGQDNMLGRGRGGLGHQHAQLCKCFLLRVDQ